MPIPGMTGGDQKPIVKYNAKAAKWKVDDVLLNTINFVIDMDSIEAGWCKFTEGAAPDFRMVKVAELLNGTPYPESPGENLPQGLPGDDQDPGQARRGQAARSASSPATAS